MTPSVGRWYERLRLEPAPLLDFLAIRISFDARPLIPRNVPIMKTTDFQRIAGLFRGLLLSIAYGYKSLKEV